MASEDVVTLQDGTFDEEVLKSETPVLVDFWAVWCQPCKAIAPAVDDLARRYKGKLKVAKMNVDEHQKVPQQYGIRSIPTLMVIRDRVLVFSQAGALPQPAFEDLVHQVRALDMDQVRAEIAAGGEGKGDATA